MTQSDGEKNDESPVETLADIPQQQQGLVAEFIEFLLHNKKWWLIPIFLIMFLMTLLAFLTASPVAPFIYTLF